MEIIVSMLNSYKPVPRPVAWLHRIRISKIFRYTPNAAGRYATHLLRQMDLSSFHLTILKLNYALPLFSRATKSFVRYSKTGATYTERSPHRYSMLRPKKLMQRCGGG